MEINIDLENDNLKIDLSKEAKSKMISIGELITEILEEYVESESIKVI